MCWRVRLRGKNANRVETWEDLALNYKVNSKSDILLDCSLRTNFWIIAWRIFDEYAMDLAASTSLLAGGFPFGCGSDVSEYSARIRRDKAVWAVRYVWSCRIDHVAFDSLLRSFSSSYRTMSILFRYFIQYVYPPAILMLSQQRFGNSPFGPRVFGSSFLAIFASWLSSIQFTWSLHARLPTLAHLTTPWRFLFIQRRTDARRDPRLSSNEEEKEFASNDERRVPRYPYENWEISQAEYQWQTTASNHEKKPLSELSIAMTSAVRIETRALVAR